MTFTPINFHIRIKEQTDFDEMVSRVESALACRLTRLTGEEFVGTLAAGTELLGLAVVLARGYSSSDPTIWVYGLTGIPADDMIILEGNPTSISSFVLAVLRARDSQNWYVPTLQELFQEAGIPFSDTELNDS